MKRYIINRGITVVATIIYMFPLLGIIKGETYIWGYRYANCYDYCGFNWDTNFYVLI